MIFYNNLNSFNHNPQKPLTVVLGNFDGLHLGHQNLIKRAVQIAKKDNGETLVLSFFPLPQVLFNPDFKILSSLDNKINLLKKLEIDKLLVIPFTKEISQLTPLEFVRDILCQKIKANNLVCGFNYSFGSQGSGKAEDLVCLAKQFGQKVYIMDPFYVHQQLVSSTKIRELINQGEIEKAQEFLGYYPKIQGRVIQGKQIGRTIGFPTANLSWDRGLMIPGVGVYAVKVRMDHTIYQGIVNLGYKPTVTSQHELTIEAHLFDFEADIYNREIEIIFYSKIRNEKLFNSLEELKNQIKDDIIKAKKYFSTGN